MISFISEFLSSKMGVEVIPILDPIRGVFFQAGGKKRVTPSLLEPYIIEYIVIFIYVYVFIYLFMYLLIYSCI